MSLPRIGSDMSLTQRAYEALKEGILDKTLAPGEVVYEVQLAEQLGISRTPLRAALQKLQYEHLVESQSGKGYRITSLNRADMEHVFFMRKLLEPAAARLAARHRGDSQVKRLYEYVRLQAEGLANDDYLEYLAYDREFHMLIAACANNMYLRSACKTAQLQGYRFLVLDEFVRNRTKFSIEEHTAIAEAIDARDGEAAARLLLEHIEDTESMLAEVLHA